MVLQVWPDAFMWPFRGIIWASVEILMRSSRTPLLVRLASRARRERAEVSDAQLAIALMAPGIVAAGAWHLAKRIRREGWRRILHTIFTPTWQGENEMQRRAQGSAAVHKERFNAVVNCLHSMPTEIFQTEDSLLLLPHEDLLGKLQARQIAPQTAATKTELVALLRKSSSETSCVICCEDFVQNDVLRRLRCGHVFHLACVDKWSLGSADYSRPVSCAMCNVPLCEKA